MDNVFEITLLMDFYGQLLTERQYEILDYHYNNDYSLGEIAEILNISRQGVHDNIKRSKILLNKMEEKLGLIERFTLQKKTAQKVLKYIQGIKKENLSTDDISILAKIEEGVIEIIDSWL